ncbi:MAG: RsmB/NOP family class I SAM-dependent RNA methyltransferase [Hyphomonas sp.]|uniref:RsmB/NOP family class I SAM-dependent RNA methyltransferase n=1 Tax=Hyphomonas sp. TaxID=87 RepID=UPI0017D85857|nr:RsmB/NOP family class I SAM-dependent RNA methyltransferase [Hyphomonas sp.]MBU3921380.1 RsmB/NOP family class I SAM-dependent RNA methyltransferase [Alphaproteobacteria bacterium]MBA3069703.1 RsmB/NOP family class I SAM-dependent RNA methyltransferase [Hyphomonas sp.]MBU4062544.1 RsmB/NOP family class I SAM-dependent RNA methyltransferase [Alphaproteobacteria bacterium]MBU4163895.1 RsmB/NOP family class I SAM-dependent RNA methyltransferase [Alphaproteobacteria bacterium]MBU4568676.1 RsmB/
MRTGGRISAATEILRDVLERHQPIKIAIRDWGKRARYAGSKDRAWVSGLVLDALRKRNSIAHHMGHDDPRALVLGALRIAWDWNARDIEQACYDDHGPTPLTNDERSRLILAPDPSAAPHVQGDFPEWMTPYMQRVFGPEAVIEAQAMAVRADVDLRVNTLKADAEKAALPLKSVKAEPSRLLKNAYHIPARDPTEREDSIEGIPAFSKGWVEVQDAGSQIAAAAANAKADEQVMDYCAGGGGKTLALAAQMEGKGQIHAYDIDGKRLSALIPRLKRSGAHNVQLVHPSEGNSLEPLVGQMDLVFVDAPCTGTGTWRRRPDSKWRIKPAQLEKRMQDQREILQAAATYVKPGGRLLYATCSFLIEEDEDRVAEFLAGNPAFTERDAAEAAIASGALTAHGASVVRKFRGPTGSVRLTPRRAGTDGFFFALLERRM